MPSTSLGEHTVSTPKQERKIRWVQVLGPLKVKGVELQKGDFLGWDQDDHVYVLCAGALNVVG